MGHPGIGTGAHLATLWFASLHRDRKRLVPVAYQGAAPIVTAVLGGEIDSGPPAYIPQVQSTKVIGRHLGAAGRFPARRADRPRERHPCHRDGHIHRARRAGRHAAGDRHPGSTGSTRGIPQGTDLCEKAACAARREDSPGGPPERLTERMNREKGALGSNRPTRQHQAAMIEKHIDIDTADGRTSTASSSIRTKGPSRFRPCSC